MPVGYAPRLNIRFWLVALICSFFILGISPSAYATDTRYDQPGISGLIFYSNPWCGCNPDWHSTGGCCLSIGAAMIFREMVKGEVLWAVDPDLENEYYIDVVFEEYLEPALRDASDDFRNLIVMDAIMKAASIDAQNLIQTLTALEKETVGTLKDYTPTTQVCRFGTLSRSLTASQSNAEMTQLAIATKAQNRQLMHTNMSSGMARGAGRTLGRTADKLDRLEQYRTKFCDIGDSNGALNNPQACAAASDVQSNRDIDATRTLDSPLTLDIDFAGGAGALTNDEENILALDSNLYAHDLATNIGQSDLTALSKSSDDEKIKKLFDFRALAAKRSVAQNSFAAIAGLKASGSAASSVFIKEITNELGITDAAQRDKLMGVNPSYYAQMEVLSKQLYQNPKFYGELMVSDANLSRIQSAMRGIESMQERDIYESLQRSEMLLSTLLEMYVMREQDTFYNKGKK